MKHFDFTTSDEYDDYLDRSAHREPPTPARTLTADDRRETLRLNFDSAFVKKDEPETAAQVEAVQS